VAHLRLLRAGLERPHGMAMLGTVLAEERDTPELLELFRERLVAPRRRELRAVLEAARAARRARDGANTEVAVTALVGGLSRPLPRRRRARRALRDHAGGHRPRRAAQRGRIAARTSAMNPAWRRQAREERRAPTGHACSARGAAPSTRWPGTRATSVAISHQPAIRRPPAA
jgi:hypothetical protein